MSLALYFTFLQGDHSMLWYIQIKNIHFLKDLMHIWHPFKCFLLLSVSSSNIQHYVMQIVGLL